mmetsp:Transcript_11629/g.24813  ORF Transcript_11629/g.24813 Transcript_11629/m.24813 type:complete len:379 (-) Transcript_11629:372-1508(-)
MILHLLRRHCPQRRLQLLLLPRLERLLHRLGQALEHLDRIQPTGAQSLLARDFRHIDGPLRVQPLLADFSRAFLVHLLALLNGADLDALDEFFDTNHETVVEFLVLHAREEGMDDVARVEFEALGQFGNVANDLTLSGDQLHLFVEAVHFVLETGEEEVVGRVLLQEDIAIMEEELLGSIHAFDGHEFFHDIGVFFREFVVGQHGDADGGMGFVRLRLQLRNWHFGGSIFRDGSRTRRGPFLLVAIANLCIRHFLCWNDGLLLLLRRLRLWCRFLCSLFFCRIFLLAGQCKSRIRKLFLFYILIHNRSFLDHVTHVIDVPFFVLFVMIQFGLVVRIRILERFEFRAEPIKIFKIIIGVRIVIIGGRCFGKDFVDFFDS